MGFSENIKLNIRKRAHFKCCICQRPYVEIHHIIPEADGGENTEENAAPLCPWCHEIYGNDSKKRKYIQQARDAWYERCAKYNSLDSEKIDKIASQLNEKATKKDLENAVVEIHDLLVSIINKPNRTTKELVQEISDVSAAISTTALPYWVHCGYCGRIADSKEEIDSGICKHCGKPFNVEWGT